MKQVILFICGCFFVSGDAFSQCCSPGNPVGGDANQGVLNKNFLRAMAVYKTSVSKDYYEGSHKALNDYSFVDRGTYNFSGISLAYGLLKNVTIEGELGYFISKKQFYNTPFGRQELIGSGLSDLSGIGKFRLVAIPHNEFEFTAGVGYKIPIGTHQQRNENGILLPIDIQAATGARGYLATFFLYKGFSEKKLKYFLTGRAQLTPYDVVFTEIKPTRFYRFGNFFTASLFSSYSINHRWSAIIQVRYEHRSQDLYKDARNPGYRVYESSGGKKIIFVPQMVFEISRGWNISAMADLPLYQYYNQKQLATAYAATVTLSKTFGLCRPVTDISKDGWMNQ